MKSLIGKVILIWAVCILLSYAAFRLQVTTGFFIPPLAAGALGGYMIYIHTKKGGLTIVITSLMVILGMLLYNSKFIYDTLTMGPDQINLIIKNLPENTDPNQLTRENLQLSVVIGLVFGVTSLHGSLGLLGAFIGRTCAKRSSITLLRFLSALFVISTLIIAVNYYLSKPRQVSNNYEDTKADYSTPIKITI